MHRKPQVSLYSQGGLQSAVYYYRYYQYLPKIDCKLYHRKQLPDFAYRILMPIGQKGLFVKLIAYLIIVCRISFFLLRDSIIKPDFLIISRTLINRRFPSFYSILLKNLKDGGSEIIWDIDDDILEIKEIRLSDYLFFCGIANTIIVASEDLIDVLPKQCHNKIVFLPTTDGTMVHKYNKRIDVERKEIYSNRIILLWVGTSSGLGELNKIIPQIEDAGEILKQYNKELILNVVSNKNIDYQPHHFKLLYEKWSRGVAEAAFLRAHIGLMPLENNMYSKGKGGCKLLQYLSVGLPSIASAIGINKKILDGNVGFLIDNLNSVIWKDTIIKLSTNIEEWSCLSKKAYERYSTKYNSMTNMEIWRNLICTHNTHGDD